MLLLIGTWVKESSKTKKTWLEIGQTKDLTSRAARNDGALLLKIRDLKILKLVLLLLKVFYCFLEFF